MYDRSPSAPTTPCRPAWRRAAWPEAVQRASSSPPFAADQRCASVPACRLSQACKSAVGYSTVCRLPCPIRRQGIGPRGAVSPQRVRALMPSSPPEKVSWTFRRGGRPFRQRDGRTPGDRTRAWAWANGNMSRKRLAEVAGPFLCPHLRDGRRQTMLVTRDRQSGQALPVTSRGAKPGPDPAQAARHGHAARVATRGRRFVVGVSYPDTVSNGVDRVTTRVACRVFYEVAK